MNAFEPTVVVEHEAVIGGFKCLYWLIKMNWPTTLITPSF